MLKYAGLGLAIVIGIYLSSTPSELLSSPTASPAGSIVSLSVRFDVVASELPPYVAGQTGDLHEVWIIGEEPVGWSMDIATGWKAGEGVGESWRVGCHDPTQLDIRTVETQSLSTLPPSLLPPRSTFASLPLQCLTSFQSTQDSYLLLDLDHFNALDPLTHLLPFFRRVGPQLLYLRLEEEAGGDEQSTLESSLYSLRPWILHLGPNLLALDIIGPQDVRLLAEVGHAKLRELFIGEKVPWKMPSLAPDATEGEEFFWLEERDEYQVVQLLRAAASTGEEAWKERWPAMRTIHLRGASFGEEGRRADGERLADLCGAVTRVLGWEVKDRDGVSWRREWEAVAG